MRRQKLAKGWEWEELNDITLEYISGGTPSTKTTKYWNGSIPWTKSANIKSKYLKSGEKFISREAVAESATNIVPKNNVLVATRVGIGKSAVNLIDVAISQDLTGLILDVNRILPIYLIYYLHSPQMQQKLAQFSRGTTIKGIQRSDLSHIEIPLPPLETQRKIVAILEKAEATQRLRAEADALMQNLRQNIFFAMFGDPEKNPFEWQEMELSEILSESLQNGLYKPSTEYGEGTPILRIDSFYEGEIIGIESLKRLRCSSTEVEKYGLNVGDILINRVNSLNYLGKCGLVEYLPEPTVYESNMIRLRLNNAITNPFYVTSLLCTLHVKNQIISKAKKAVNQASINQMDALSLKILVPPIEIQKNYEDRVRRTESVQRLQKRSQKQHKKLMKSLQSKAFTGELVA